MSAEVGSEEFNGGAATETVENNGNEGSYPPSGRSSHHPRDHHRGGGHHDRRAQALTVYVDERGIEPALRAFKKLIAKEGLLKDLKRRQSYEKPGARKRRKQREASRRRRRVSVRAIWSRARQGQGGEVEPRFPPSRRYRPRQALRSRCQGAGDHRGGQLRLSSSAMKGAVRPRTDQGRSRPAD